MKTLLGIALLLTIVLTQVVVSRRRQSRVRRLWAAGVDAMRRRQWDAAIDAFRKCTKSVPSAGLFHRALGAALVGAGRPREAEERIRLGAQLDPKDATAQAELGLFLAVHAPDRPDDAIAALEQAVRYAPKLRDEFRKDARFAPLMQHPRFRELVKE